MRGNDGANQFVQAIGALTRRYVSTPEWLAEGMLLADGSLKVDRFAVPFPPGQFYLLRQLTLQDDPMETPTTSSTSVGDHGSHTHTVAVARPPALTPPATGERVLVAWMNTDRQGVPVDPVLVGRLERTGGA